jgi:hypothetical protein
MGDETLTYTTLGGKLELLPQGISYKDELHPYSAVEHLGRYASRTSFYFIPVIDFLRLRIYVRGREKPITVQNGIGLAFTTSGLQKIHERLVELTFQQRAKAYMKQAQARGFFAYGGAQFHSSGEIRFKGSQYDVKTAKFWLEPFHLVIKAPSFFSFKRKISCDIDQDVFLALLRELYGITFNR